MLDKATEMMNQVALLVTYQLFWMEMTYTVSSGTLISSTYLWMEIEHLRTYALSSSHMADINVLEK